MQCLFVSIGDPLCIHELSLVAIIHHKGCGWDLGGIISFTSTRAATLLVGRKGRDFWTPGDVTTLLYLSPSLQLRPEALASDIVILSGLFYTASGSQALVNIGRKSLPPLRQTKSTQIKYAY